jgi:hypothetical protein
MTLKPGIQPWSDWESLAGIGVAWTLTVAAKNCADTVSAVGQAVDSLTDRLPGQVRWVSRERPLPESVYRRRRWLQEWNASAPASLTDRYLDLDLTDPQAVPCSAGRLVHPFTMAHFDLLSVPFPAWLILSRHADLSPRDVCDALRQFRRKVAGPRALADLLRAQPDWVIGRAYDDGCGHCALQFFGSEADLEYIAGLLREAGVARVDNREALLNVWRA